MKQIPGIEKQVLVASGNLSPKNSEGSAITLKDGRILFTWTQFFDSDTLLTVWNSNWNPDCGHDVTRCPLLCATSEHGGASWHPPKVIETDPDYEWAYPGILFHKDHALLHYFRCHREKRGQREMILARVPVEWFTE